MQYGSLEARLCILVGGLLFSLLFAVGYLQVKEQRSFISETKSAKFEIAAKLVYLAYEKTISENSIDENKTLAQKSLASDSDIQYISITDSSGKKFLDYIRDNPSKKTTKNISAYENTSDIISSIDPLFLPKTIPYSYPIELGSNRHGTLTIAFSTASIINASEIFDNKLLLTFAVVLVFGFLGAITLARTIVHPLKKLTDATAKVANGDLTVNVNVNSTDEIENLTASFNNMIVSLKEYESRLINRASMDSLTDLFNHRYFQERLKNELLRAERYNHPLSIIMIDIDHFKVINDSFGHITGDAVLKEFALLLASLARGMDVIARYGGEEFAIILPETPLDKAEYVAERIRSATKDHVFETNNIPVMLTVSLGVSQFPIHTNDSDGLIMAADLAMYRAKSLGRDHVIAYSSDDEFNNINDPYHLYLLLHATDEGTVEAISVAIDTKCQNPVGFSLKIAEDAVAIARATGLCSEENCTEIKIAALLHDIGKLGMPDHIFTNPDKLTDEELKIVMGHPNLGHNIVQRSPKLQTVLPGILHHHERWDGAGYPDGLIGENIPLIARIIAAADAYQTILGKLPKDDQAKENAIKKLQIYSGKQLDPNIVEVYLHILASN